MRESRPTCQSNQVDPYVCRNTTIINSTNAPPAQGLRQGIVLLPTLNVAVPNDVVNSHVVPRPSRSGGGIVPS